jgi:Coiled-coil domain-containing protein 90-like
VSTARKPLLFDTLDSAKRLEEAGIPQKQAEAYVRLFAKIVEESICSKQDLLETKGDIEAKLLELKRDIEAKLLELKRDIEAKLLELKGDIEAKLLELKRDIEAKLLELKGDVEIRLQTLEIKLKETEGCLRLEIAQSKNELIKWFIGTFLVSIGLFTGLFTLILKLMH